MENGGRGATRLTAKSGQAWAAGLELDSRLRTRTAPMHGEESAAASRAASHEGMNDLSAERHACRHLKELDTAAEQRGGVEGG